MHTFNEFTCTVSSSSRLNPSTYTVSKLNSLVSKFHVFLEGIQQGYEAVTLGLGQLARPDVGWFWCIWHVAYLQSETLELVDRMPARTRIAAVMLSIPNIWQYVPQPVQTSN